MITRLSLGTFAFTLALPVPAQSSQSLGDSVVLAWVAADVFVTEMSRLSWFRPSVVLAPMRIEDGGWHGLVVRALVDHHPTIMTPVADSSSALQLRIMEFVVGPDTARVRVSWSQCEPWPVSNGWGHSMTYRFARVPGTWVFVRPEHHQWVHGRCQRSPPRPPTPRPPSSVHRIPPPDSP